MARRIRFSLASDEMFDFCCSICEKDNLVTEAAKQCLDCGEYYCAKCFAVHKKINIMADHRVLDHDHMRGWSLTGAKLRGAYSVRVEHYNMDRYQCGVYDSDTYQCDVRGSCMLADGTMLVTDWENQKLKRLDANYDVTGHLDMLDSPWGVTCTAPDEVAVTMTDARKVQFILVDTDAMFLSRSFSTTDDCRGICFSSGELFVACGGLHSTEAAHVSVYTIHGRLLRTIQDDVHGQRIFSCPRHISVSHDGSHIYVTDREGGVIALDRNGLQVTSFNVPSLEGAWGLCQLETGNILVCGYLSDNVLQLDERGVKTKELLGISHGVDNPTSLCYDVEKARLVITMYGTGVIKVFDLF